MNTKKLLSLATAILAAVSAQALELGAPFSDGAVLQRDMKVPVWGEADPSARVTVSFAGQVRETTTGADGAWRVDLSPLQTSAEGRTMTVTSGSSKVEVRDVLVGEVWLCAGQSNMDAPIWNTTMHYADAKGGLRGQMTRKPLVRYCSSGQVASIRPLRKTKSKCTWRKFLPENLGGGWPHFSAVGFYFALELHNALGVPVGVVGMSWGGTTIRAWTPPEGMRSVEATRSAADQELLEGAAFQKKVDEAKARGEKYLPEFHQQPSAIYNGQVRPFAPMAARGLVWYQGETDGWMGVKYADWLHALYNGWTKAFENPALGMRFTQLAPAGSGNLAPVMEGQAAFAREEPNARMSVISDRGATHDWHPTDKETVGMRLAALALKYDYGWKDLKADAPSLRSWRLEGNRFVLSFDHAEGWILYNEDWTNDNLFEIAGTDGVWHAATIANMKVRERKPYVSNGQIDGKDLVVFSPEVAEPAHLRYHYQRPQVRANLFNEVGLPLGPLHVDVGSPKDIDVVAVYYPHWHRYPKGTEWFGEKWNEGEWDFVKTAVPRYPGHRVPMKPLPGYLNGRDPKDVETEIALASNAGIDVFLYDYYYYCARFEEICRERGIACRAGTDADLVAALKACGTAL